MKGVYRKELRQYFHSMTGYAFIAMFLCISGVVFTVGNLIPQNGKITVFFSSFSSVMLYLLPILTMRVYAEEKKQRTDELLMTAPVSAACVMAGKFLAAFTVFLIPLAGTLLYPAVLARFGFWEGAAVLGNYAGCMLLGAALIAIGQFISVLSESQFVAAIVTYSLFTLLSIAGNMSASAGSPALRALLRFAAVPAHMDGFSWGVFPLADAVYYLSVALLFLLGCVYVLQRKRVA